MSTFLLNFEYHFDTIEISNNAKIALKGISNSIILILNSIILILCYGSVDTFPITRYHSVYKQVIT